MNKHQAETTSLTTAQMAHFAARGFVTLTGVVPTSINQQFLGDIGDASPRPDTPKGHYANIMQASLIPLVAPGTPIAQAYPADSALHQLLQVPAVAGAIDSLVGPDSLLDHHFLHIAFPPHMYPEEAPPLTSQPTHQDSTIDPRQAFDVQLLYFPHEVTPDMGGTRYIPGSHLRVVSETAVARYQNIVGQQHVVCPAGTVVLFHMGLWHGGGLNRSEQLRYMFKIRLSPTQRQCRLWCDEPLEKEALRPIFWTDGQPDEGHLHQILTTPEKWFEQDTGRLEYLNRIRFWRYISGDENFDADYWLSRIENEYT
ncbi:MAG: phytanoyl-CoA dioxygenase family protein [Pseudomonadota bacterium]